MAERGRSDAPEGTIHYSAVGYNDNGGYVNVRMWGDWMDIRSDGHLTIQSAIDEAPNLFGQDKRVSFVSVNESVKQGPGQGWIGGREVARVEREQK